MTSVSTSIAIASNASSKPWFLTFDPETNDVLIWKSGMRLKLKDGSSSGRVTAISVLSGLEKTITVSRSMISPYIQCNTV